MDDCPEQIPTEISENTQWGRRNQHYKTNSRRLDPIPPEPELEPPEDNYTFWARNCYEILRGALIFGFIVVGVIFLGVAFINAFCDGFHYVNIFLTAALIYCFLFLILFIAQYFLGWQEGPPPPSCLDRCLESNPNVITRPMKSPVMSANAYFATHDKLQRITAAADAYEGGNMNYEEPPPRKYGPGLGDVPPKSSSGPEPSRTTSSKCLPSQLREYQFQESRRNDTLCWDEPQTNSTVRYQDDSAGCGNNLDSTVRHRCSCASSNQSQRPQQINPCSSQSIRSCTEDSGLTRCCPPGPRRTTAASFFRTEDY